MPDYIKRPKLYSALEYNGQYYDSLIGLNPHIQFHQEGGLNSAPRIFVWVGKPNNQKKHYLEKGDWVVFDHRTERVKVYDKWEFEKKFEKVTVPNERLSWSSCNQPLNQ